MAVPNIFEELDAALKDFRTFLETEDTVQFIKNTVQYNDPRYLDNKNGCAKLANEL